MKTYPIPMVPGPVRVPPQVFEAYCIDYGSGDLEIEFLELYNRTETNLQKLFATQNHIVIQTGEGMLALWAALKSCLLPGDRVLSIASGVFGYGISEMAQSIGATVRTVNLPYDQTISNWQEIEQAIAEFRPKMITVVHCETPSGTLNPLAELGHLKKQYEVPLLYVDAVASVGGTAVLVDDWKIDLALGGSQKALSVPPSLSFLAISESAWEVIDQVNYVGYEALKPFRTAQQNFYFPYTPYWHGIAALNAGAELVLHEGLQACFERHTTIAEYCRQRLTEIGYQLFPAPSAIPSPTVTAVYVPDGITWEEFDRKLRQRGLAVGGSYGPLAGKVFRLGHMGTQANRELVDQALNVLKDILGEIR
ncbi:MAG: alanine--glyoxylate aminotransferase family protein [Anaerolineales bacterium]